MQHHLIVGLVAGAGGLAALDEVLGLWPADSPASVIVLLHTSPDRDSDLAEILQRVCVLPMTGAEDGRSSRAAP